MICIRCGYCCKHLVAIIVDNPELGPIENNLIVQEGNGKSCKHLQGEKPGEYSCALHDYEWYKKTPCYQYTQIENKNSICRIGEYMLKK